MHRTALLLVLLLAALPLAAQQNPYFVTYDHHLEEPGNLEIANTHTVGFPRSGQTTYWAPLAEIEYGVNGWWTTEFYLEGQARGRDSAIFTGWRWENRFKPIRGEHRINPIFYLEYESVNEGSLVQKEVVGHAPELNEPNDVLRQVHAHELEAKLILSSNVHDWNIAENFIFEKNLSEDEGVEFGYAFGISRPLARIASGQACRLCRENFVAGIEIYGGLGSSKQFGFAETAHYIAPAISWQISDSTALRISPGFGLTEHSAPVLLRIGYSYEIHGFGRTVKNFFGGKN